MATLFKYLKPPSLCVLENLSLRFSPIAEFNDPFECNGDPTIVNDPIWRQQTEDQMWAMAGG